MRVVHVDTGRGLRGGQRQVMLLHRELLDRDIDSVVVAPAGSPLVSACREGGLAVAELPGRRPWRPGVLGGLRRVARDADVLHAHDPHSALLAVLGARGDQAVVCHRRAGFPMRRGVAHRLKYRRVDRWIAVTDAIRRDLLSWGVAAERCWTVPSAIDLEAVRRGAAADPVAVRRSLGLDPEARLVVGVGALDRQKGLDVLIEAAAKLDDGVSVVIVGDGPERRRLERLAGPRTRVVGAREDVPEILATAAACVVPSVADEGSSAVLKEALAVGRAVVASDLPGLREVGADAVRWVPAGDSAALADAISELMEEPSSSVERVRRGRERAAAFGVETMVDSILATYRDVLGVESP